MTSHGINGHTNGRRRTMTEAEVARMGRQIDREAKVREARKAAARAAAKANPGESLAERVALIKANRAARAAAELELIAQEGTTQP